MVHEGGCAFAVLKVPNFYLASNNMQLVHRNNNNNNNNNNNIVSPLCKPSLTVPSPDAVPRCAPEGWKSTSESHPAVA